MTKTRDFPEKLAIPFLACGLLAALAVVSRAADKPDLSGDWNFNPKQSDDAPAKIHGAQERSTMNRRRPGGSYPGGGYPSGGGYPGGGYPGGGGMPGTDYPGGGMGGPVGGVRIGLPGGGVGMGHEGPRISDEEWDAMAATPKTLKIEQREKEIVLRDASGDTETLHPDGKKHKEENLQGKKVSTKTRWEGDKLTTESKLGHSGKFTETYRLSAEGKQLEVISRLEDPALDAPLTIRRVYDRASTPSH